MEFTGLYLAILVVMLAAWFAPRTIAVALFGVTFIGAVALFLHHATDVLKLSF